MNWLKRLSRRLRRKRSKFSLVWHSGDTPPDRLKRGQLVVAHEDGELWVAAMRCPCGCGERIELVLLPTVKPSWKLRWNSPKSPTLFPSIHRTTGCKSHFWLRRGRIQWCHQNER